MTSIELGSQISDILRRLSNIIRVGTIAEVNFTEAKASVQIGDNTTKLLPWIVKAGDDLSWVPLVKGEQVLVLAPNGNLTQGIILASLYQKNKKPPAQEATIRKVVFADGSSATYDTKNKTLSLDLKGSATIIVKGNATVEAESATIKAKSTTINGDVSVSGKVSLAGGGAAIARVGDSVQVDPASHKGTITQGSKKATSG